MEVVKTNIYKQLKRSNLIVWAVVICSGLVSIFAIWTVQKVSANAERYVYTISSDEQLLPLEQIEKKEVQEIYRKSHVKLFLEHFYGYDQWNYKRRIEKALWLIDEDGKELYNFYRQDGHFNRMVQTTSSQSILDINPQFDADGNFQVSAIIQINKVNQEVPKEYLLTARGKLKKVAEHYPLNPYGYVITNYKEINKKLVEHE
ncbi:hypothetical protein [Flagellimonas beolgyonensis]|uniref:hypothetical protein n=1 Tax=Flagellimonas beolgyonensis TaxID=864064 RepID=UPI000F8EBDB8|nr:hypothetical protein [Allomuricauda beolgyonensis]